LGKKCEACHDAGWITEKSTPEELITEKGDELFKAYRWFHEHHTLPAHGGMCDQTQIYFAASEYIDSASAVFRGEAQRKKALADSFADKIGSRKRGDRKQR
jgi:hypothetical protein